MALTAREWLLLPEAEQKKKGKRTIDRGML